MNFKSKLPSKQVSMTLSLMALSYLSQAQNSGIGTSTPGSKLEIVADAPNDATKAALHVKDNVGNSLLFMRNDGNMGIGTAIPQNKLDINNPALGSSLGNRVNWFGLNGSSGNGELLNIFHNRYIAGTNWNSAEIKIQKRVDVTDMHYMSFRGNAGFSSLNFGYGVTDQMVILENGNIGIGNSNPTSKLHIKSSATSTDFALIVQNGALSPLFFVRNDGLALMGSSVQNSYLWLDNPSGRLGFSSENGFTQILMNTPKMYFANGTSGSNAFAQINPSNGNWLIGSPNTNVWSANLTNTKLYIQGIDATSSNYALNVENAANTNLLSVRNDGFISIGGGTIGAAKLEVIGGSNQGIYSTSNNIALNGSGSANGSIAVSAHMAPGFAGTSLYIRGYHTSNILIDIVNSTQTSISRMLDNGNFGIGTSAPSALIHFKNGHIRSEQTTVPTIVTTTQNGITAAAIAANSSDTKGKITTTGTNNGINTVLTITFNTAYVIAPTIVITATNANAQACTYFVSSTTTTFTLNFKGGGATPSFNYYIIE